eukprot:1147281-Pelagomonas_calceolata.AAC.2
MNMLAPGALLRSLLSTPITNWCNIRQGGPLNVYCDSDKTTPYNNEGEGGIYVGSKSHASLTECDPAIAAS